MNTLSQIMKSIEHKEKLDKNYINKHYNSYAVNKCFSRSIYSLVYANIINQYSNVDKNLQYDFYYYGLSSNNYYGHKCNNNVSKHFDNVKQYYNYNDEKTLSVIETLTEDQLVFIGNQIRSINEAN